MAKVTVLVVTYHSDWSKVKLTLNGILIQDYDDYEIVIADDGSSINHRDKIEAYFKKRNFTNYKLVMNEENQGTVKNILSGLAVATGTYVRGFGAGDLFYEPDSLRKAVEFMDQTGYEGVVGLVKGYSVQSGKVTNVPYHHPFDIEAYRKHNPDKIQRNLLVYSDNVTGAAMFCKLSYYKEYLEKIQDYVIYEEDIFQVMAALDGRELHLYPQPLVWYEADTGISTTRSAFQKKLAQDVERFYQHLFTLYPDNPWVQKRKSLMGFYKIENLYLRTALRFFKDPGEVPYVLSHYLQILTKKYQ